MLDECSWDWQSVLTLGPLYVYPPSLSLRLSICLSMCVCV